MQQPLAFTIVKTVVTARDEDRALPPSVALAWDLLREELSASARAAEASVSWGPEERGRLKVLIQGVGDCMVNDPALEREFATLLDESERVEAPLPGGGSDDASEAEASVASEPGPPPRTSPPARQAIPMIALPPELEAELAPSGFPAVDEAPAVGEAPAAGRSPAMTAEIAEQMPVYAPLDREGDPAPIIPSNLNPTALGPKATSAPLIAIGVVALLLLLAGVAYLWSDSGPDAVETEPPPAGEAPAAALPGDPDPPVATAPTAANHRDDGDYAAAHEAQRAYAASLENEGAPPAVRARAQATLAELSLAAADPKSAVVEQREAIALAKAAHGAESAIAADEHLAMASYYLQTGETVMADGHYRQGRQLLRKLPDSLTEARALRLQQLGDRLGLTN